MKNTALVLALAVATALWMQLASAKTLKVLMVGNSFSQSVLEQWPQCAASAGDTLDLASLFIGACSLSKHWANVEKSSDPDFKPYGFVWNYASTKEKDAAPVARLGDKTNIPQALVADKWDVVTIQQVSSGSPWPETYEPFAGKLIAKIRELAPQAEIVVQETWSYAPYDKRLGKWKMTPDEMHSAIKKAYAQLAERYKLRTIPMGDAVQLYRQRLPVDYGTPLADDEIAAIRGPALVDFHGDVVGSSRWGRGNAWDKDKDVYRLRLDPIHLNKDGHYLQALVWQATLFGTDVNKLTYRPDHVTEAKAELMRKCAMDAVHPVVTRWTGDIPVRTLASGAPAPGLGEIAPRSVFVEGDFARFEKVWARLERGEGIRIAVIGGSITRGALASAGAPPDSTGNRWSDRFCDGWRRAFPDAKIDSVNAGVGATGSNIGAYRLKRDVLDKKPDVVVVEFSVNDKNTPERAESYEGVVRQLLNAPGDIAVVLLGMVLNDGQSAQECHGKVARHYNLPFVSYRDAIYPCVESGAIEWSDISPDVVHPNYVGHAYAAALLNHYLASKYVDWKSSGRPPAPIPPLPAPLFGTRYDKGDFLEMTTIKTIENKGFFPLRDICWGEGLACTNASSRLSFEVEGSTVALLYRLGRDPYNWGKIDVSIDGENAASGLDCFRDQEWWYTPSLVLCRDKPGRHVVEIVALPEKDVVSNGYGCHLTGVLVSE